MRWFIVFVRTLGGKLAWRIAIDPKFRPSRLKSRVWIKIRHLIPPFRVPFARSRKARVRTLAERLGYGPEARLLIVHADDLGMAHSVNTAFIAGLAKGLINSGSAMVPCPAFIEIAAFAQCHPEADIGIHLTLTSQQAAHPWAPVAPAAQIPSLVDQRGCFYQTWTPQTRIVPAEVEIELRAQIEKAYASGLHPTHLDSHQFKLQRREKALFEVYAHLSREYKLPMLISTKWFTSIPFLQSSLCSRDIVLDHVVTINPEGGPDRWPTYYRKLLEELPTGVSEFLIHPAHDDEEMQALFEGELAWGAAWRQRDFNFFTSDEFQDLLKKHDVKLTTWREIAKAVL